MTAFHPADWIAEAERLGYSVVLMFQPNDKRGVYIMKSAAGEHPDRACGGAYTDEDLELWNALNCPDDSEEGKRRVASLIAYLEINGRYVARQRRQ
jgi:hypothetical protein